MSFASTLNMYCSALGCTNREIADRCGISPSALSRYRNGSRTPDVGSSVLTQLARGIAELSRERGMLASVNEDEVQNTLELSVDSSDASIEGFGYRLDALLSAASMSNASAARLLGVDPSYISRIRSGSRMPADREDFARRCSRVVVARCVERETVEALSAVVGSLPSVKSGTTFAFGGDLDVSQTCDVVEHWLLGQSTSRQRTVRTRHMLDALNGVPRDVYKDMAATFSAEGEPSAPVGSAHLARGITALRDSMLEFCRSTLKAGVTEVKLFSDLPFAAMFASEQHFANFQAGIAALITAGVHVNVVHDLECSLSETLQQIDFWMPLYLSGRVSGYFLRGMHGRVYHKLNFASQACVLSCEVMAGHFEDSWRFISYEPYDVECLMRRADHALELSSPHFEVFREDDESRMGAFRALVEQFESEGEGLSVTCRGYENLQIVVYPHDYAVITRKGAPAIYFVVFNQKIGHSLRLMNQSE